MIAEVPAGGIGPAFVPRPRPTVVGVELDGEAVLYSEHDGSLHLLDPVATAVWNVLDGEATLRELAGELADAFEAEPGVVERDVVELVRGLGARGLLAGVAADPAGARDADPTQPGEADRGGP
ncbi:MAG: PqqD family protein [Egibacteraceae bacterium]